MRYHSSPTSVNQKLDNVKAGLSFISQRGGEGSISGISPEGTERGGRERERERENKEE